MFSCRQKWQRKDWQLEEVSTQLRKRPSSPTKSKTKARVPWNQKENPNQLQALQREGQSPKPLATAVAGHRPRTSAQTFSSEPSEVHPPYRHWDRPVNDSGEELLIGQRLRRRAVFSAHHERGLHRAKGRKVKNRHLDHDRRTPACDIGKTNQWVDGGYATWADSDSD